MANKRTSGNKSMEQATGISALIEKVKNSEQTISMLFGIGVVLLIGGLSYRYFKNKGKNVFETKETAEIQETTREKLTENGTGITEQQVKIGLPTVHTVIKGENLWRIAQKYFTSGYNWVDIAKANNLRNANLLAVGQKLNIPTAAVRKPISELPKTGISLQNKDYVVQKGDSLSKISMNIYGTYFRWEQIYEANKGAIADPNLIYPGQKIKI